MKREKSGMEIAAEHEFKDVAKDTEILMYKNRCEELEEKLKIAVIALEWYEKYTDDGHIVIRALENIE